MTSDRKGKRQVYDIVRSSEGVIFIVNLTTEEYKVLKGFEYFIFTAIAGEECLTDLENSSDVFLSKVWTAVCDREQQELYN